MNLQRGINCIVENHCLVKKEKVDVVKRWCSFVKSNETVKIKVYKDELKFSEDTLRSDPRPV